MANTVNTIARVAVAPITTVGIVTGTVGAVALGATAVTVALPFMLFDKVNRVMIDGLLNLDSNKYDKDLAKLSDQVVMSIAQGMGIDPMVVRTQPNPYVWKHIVQRYMELMLQMRTPFKKRIGKRVADMFKITPSEYLKLQELSIYGTFLEYHKPPFELDILQDGDTTRYVANVTMDTAFVTKRLCDLLHQQDFVRLHAQLTHNNLSLLKFDIPFQILSHMTYCLTKLRWTDDNGNTFMYPKHFALCSATDICTRAAYAGRNEKTFIEESAFTKIRKAVEDFQLANMKNRVVLQEILESLGVEGDMTALGHTLFKLFAYYAMMYEQGIRGLPFSLKDGQTQVTLDDVTQDISKMTIPGDFYMTEAPWYVCVHIMVSLLDKVKDRLDIVGLDPKEEVVLSRVEGGGWFGKLKDKLKDNKQDPPEEQQEATPTQEPPPKKGFMSKLFKKDKDHSLITDVEEEPAPIIPEKPMSIQDIVSKILDAHSNNHPGRSYDIQKDADINVLQNALRAALQKASSRGDLGNILLALLNKAFVPYPSSYIIHTSWEDFVYNEEQIREEAKQQRAKKKWPSNLGYTRADYHYSGRTVRALAEYAEKTNMDDKIFKTYLKFLKDLVPKKKLK